MFAKLLGKVKSSLFQEDALSTTLFDIALKKIVKDTNEYHWRVGDFGIRL